MSRIVKAEVFAHHDGRRVVLSIMRDSELLFHATAGSEATLALLGQGFLMGLRPATGWRAATEAQREELAALLGGA